MFGKISIGAEFVFWRKREADVEHDGGGALASQSVFQLADRLVG